MGERGKPTVASEVEDVVARIEADPEAAKRLEALRQLKAQEPVLPLGITVLDDAREDKARAERSGGARGVPARVTKPIEFDNPVPLVDVGPRFRNADGRAITQVERIKPALVANVEESLRRHEEEKAAKDEERAREDVPRALPIGRRDALTQPIGRVAEMAADHDAEAAPLSAPKRDQGAPQAPAPESQPSPLAAAPQPSPLRRLRTLAILIGAVAVLIVVVMVSRNTQETAAGSRAEPTAPEKGAVAIATGQADEPPARPTTHATDSATSGPPTAPATSAVLSSHPVASQVMSTSKQAPSPSVTAGAPSVVTASPTPARTATPSPSATTGRMGSAFNN